MSERRATLAGRWRQAVEAVPERPFLVWEDSAGAVAQWSYAAFDALVGEVGAMLATSGVSTGSRVQLVLTNSPAFVATWLAATRLGACVVPSDPRSSARELALHIERTRPVVAVVGRSSAAAHAEASASRGGGPQHVVVDEDDTVLEPLRSPAAVRAAPLPGPAQPAAVMFTSGTTSTPKGVVVTQANYAFTGDVMATAAQLGVADRQLVVLPLFHANAQYYSIAAAISVGASVALMHAFSASRFLEQAARHAATHASLFAAPMRMILASGAAPVAGLRLRHCWYAQNVNADQYTELSRLLGCRPRQLYGMTETIPAVLTNGALAPVADSMGTVTLGCDVDLQEGEGRPVRDGETGEVVVRGVRGVTLFDEYLDDPRTTEASFRDGVFLTGDRAWRDGEGRFFFAGRGSDVLKVAGENVSVVEVEAVIAAHPGVFEAAVVGAPDPIRDEVAVAYVVRAAGHASLDEAALLSWCAERLAPAKRPRSVHFVDELPRTSVGKIRKFLLRDTPAATTGAAR
ncbi:MAG TPA: AMP-binding protein [Candidatus Dormibacteraeota bacterium]